MHPKVEQWVSELTAIIRQNPFYNRDADPTCMTRIRKYLGITINDLSEMFTGYVEPCFPISIMNSVLNQARDETRHCINEFRYLSNEPVSPLNEEEKEEQLELFGGEFDEGDDSDDSS